MARSPVPVQIIGPAGDAIPGAEITLKDRDSGSASTHFSAESGGTSSSAVITTDALGETGRWATPGRYKIDISPPSPNPLGLSSRTDVPIDIASGLDIDDSATITHTISGSVLTFAVGAGSITGTHIATTAEPQMTALSFGIAPTSVNAITIRTSASRTGGVHVSGPGQGTFDYGAAITSDHNHTLINTTGYRGLWAKKVVRGAGAVGGAPLVTGAWIVIEDDDDVQLRSIQSVANGTPGILETTTVHTFAEGERVAVQQCTNASYNGIWTVGTPGQGLDGTHVPLVGTSGLGTAGAAGQIGNAPTLTGLVVQSGLRVERTSMLYSAGSVNSDDFSHITASNSGTAMAGGGFLLGSPTNDSSFIDSDPLGGPYTKGPAYWSGFPIEGSVRWAYGFGASYSAPVKFTEAVLDTRRGEQVTGANAIWLRNGHTIVSTTAAGGELSAAHLLSLDTSDQVRLAASGNNVVSDSPLFTITAAASAGLTAQSTSNSTTATLAAKGKTSGGVVVWGLLEANSSNVAIGSTSNHAVFFRQNAAAVFRLNLSGHMQTESGKRIGIGVDPTAALHFVAGTTAADGIAFGSDVTLYRIDVDSLKTDDVFLVNRNGMTGAGGGGTGGVGLSTLGRIDVTRASGTGDAFRGYVDTDTQPRLTLTFSSPGVGLNLGAGGSTAPDTNLYRSASQVLKTDVSFHVGFDFRHLGTNVGFYNVAAVPRPAAYTQTYSTADRTLGAYTADVESTAYTGAADGEAKLADLNALRVAVENLRLFVEDAVQQHNSMLDDLQAVGLLQ
jgi:hypothetical protein